MGLWSTRLITRREAADGTVKLLVGVANDSANAAAFPLLIACCRPPTLLQLNACSCHRIDPTARARLCVVAGGVRDGLRFLRFDEEPVSSEV